MSKLPDSKNVVDIQNLRAIFQGLLQFLFIFSQTYGQQSPNMLRLSSFHEISIDPSKTVSIVNQGFSHKS